MPCLLPPLVFFLPLPSFPHVRQEQELPMIAPLSIRVLFFEGDIAFHSFSIPV